MLNKLINMYSGFSDLYKKDKDVLNDGNIEVYTKNGYGDFTIEYKNKDYLFVFKETKYEPHKKTFISEDRQRRTKIIFTFSNFNKADYLGIQFYYNNTLLFKPQPLITISTNFKGFLEDIEDFQPLQVVDSLLELDTDIMQKQANYVNIKLLNNNLLSEAQKINIINNLVDKYLLFNGDVYIERRNEIGFYEECQKKSLYKYLNCELYGFINNCTIYTYNSYDCERKLYKLNVAPKNSSHSFDFFLMIDDRNKYSKFYIIKDDKIRSKIVNIEMLFLEKELPYIESGCQDISNYKKFICEDITKILIKYHLPERYYHLLDSNYYVPLSDIHVKSLMPLTEEHIKTIRLLD